MTPDMPRIRKILREARQATGLTQTQAAHQVGLSRMQLYRLEQESSRAPSMQISTLYRLCKVYGLSADVLLGLATDDMHKKHRDHLTQCNMHVTI